MVKAAPAPSVTYKETVCTVGLTEKSKWIRLYPIDFRYLKPRQKYSKYQWINVEIRKNKKDFRIDSYRPSVKSITPIGKKLPTRDGWEKRKKIVLPNLSKSLEELTENYEKSVVSIGIFKPKRIDKFYIEAIEKGWSAKHQQTLSQLVLIGEQPKKLERIPFNFSYKFWCDDKRCKGHKLKIIDWEVYELYRKMRTQNFPAMDVVLKKVKQTWYDKMWGKDRDSYLIVGTVFPRKSFVVLGVFWPPK